MTDKNVRLTRRKVLGALGVAGAGAALGGAGTAALFSDEEQFENNRIVAGSLDLKVDWEEHYSYPQIYGFDDPTDGLSQDVTRSEPQENSENYQALPDPENPAVWVHQEDLSDYMDNTAIEAYPDPDDDGIQNDFGTGQVGDACTDGADTPDALDPSGLRTNNADTLVDEDQQPLVNLDDIKPGDFGELTLSFHLCNNPGYIWLNGELVEAAENGHMEPESAEGAENGEADEVVTELGQGDDIELLDEIEATVWYDGDCDNVLEPGGDDSGDDEFADVVIVMDRSNSMSGDDDPDPLDQAKNGAEALIDALGPDDQVGLVSFSGDSEGGTDDSALDAGLTTDHANVKTAVTNLTAGGRTNMEAAVERAHEELLSDDTFSEYGESDNARSGARKIMVVLSDGQPNEGTDVTDTDNISPVEEAGNAKTDGIEVFTISYAGGPTTILDQMASDPSGNPASQYAYIADVSDIVDVFQDIGGAVGSAGEQVITRGSLREVLTELADGDGIALDGDLSTEERSCYPGLQTSCVGLAWHLPEDTGNEVQSDSVSFNLGFYAEQCRNNPEPGTTGNVPT